MGWLMLNFAQQALAVAHQNGIIGFSLLFLSNLEPPIMSTIDFIVDVFSSVYLFGKFFFLK